MSKSIYSVVVSNLGTVHRGPSKTTAMVEFDEYVAVSKAKHGRASGESVTLFQDNEPLKEYTPMPSIKPEKLEFVCRPVCAYSENPDGTPACIEECELADAQWIGVYRRNNLDENPTAQPSDWMFDIALDPNNDMASREKTLSMAQGLCELLNGITPQEALHNPKLHIFFK